MVSLPHVILVEGKDLDNRDKLWVFLESSWKKLTDIFLTVSPFKLLSISCPITDHSDVLGRGWAYQ